MPVALPVRRFSLALVLAVLALLPGPAAVQAEPRSGAPAPPPVSARAWLVADADTGEVLAAHDAHRRLPPASTLKILLALTLLPKFDGDRTHVVTESELAGVGEGSSVVGLEEGGEYRLSDLWNGLFLRSGNDAAHVLAELNGGWERTAEDMTALAGALGGRDTTVVSPDGYDAAGQASSAHDLALFAVHGLHNPEFAGYAGTAAARFPAGGPLIHNTNRLLTGRDGVRRYPGLIGVKNGYTSRAGNTLVAAARRDGRTLVVSLLDPRSGVPNAVYEETRTLLDWGFTAAGRVRPVGALGS
ncbi:serine hydrolase [Streptomyces sp. NPDC089919]|uniref:D-alanyl-D-alanine carboxypeptidase family protein n=1 Tax=Streptomyces sp. NPDC089919 TaxID=3155188 RepID=UPI00343CDC9B